MFNKKVQAILMVLAIAVTNAFALTGTGTEEDPYQIATLANLIELSEDSSLWTSFFLQTTDIDASATSILNEGAGFNPIGYYIDYFDNQSFTGSYNGNGFTISNLYINRPNSEYIALFGYVVNASFSDLGLIENDIIGEDKVASLVASGWDSTINNCYANGIVNGRVSVGGLVAYFDGAINNSHTTGSVTGASNVVGGLGGEISGSLNNSYSTCNVNGNGRVGGLAGQFISASVANCHASGIVEGEEIIGGLAGKTSNSEISYCHASGNVIAIGNWVGGLFGNATASSINSCSASGAVNGATWVGGLAGMTPNSTVNNSYAIGSVVGDKETGGLVGKVFNESIITNCYSVGAVSANTWVGGLVGRLDNSSTVNNSFWNISTSGQETSYGGEGKSTTEMLTLSTYLAAGWDFIDETENGTDDHWNFGANHYPYLTWQEIGATDNESQDVPLNLSQIVTIYPNPFNPETTISFSLFHKQNVILEIYNIKGQKVKSIYNNYLEAGNHKFVWNGKDKNNRPVASGVYFSKITSEAINITQKMILIK